MYIGQVATQTGATKKAIHHYEALGLLPDVQRKGRYRIYNHHHVVIISMIKKAQSLGFALADIAPVILAKHNTNQFPLAVSDAAIDQKRNELKESIAKAQALDAELVKIKAELHALFISEK